MTRSGRSGPPAPRVQLPVVAPPPPPGGVTMRVTETAVVLEWKPPEVTVSSYNVYRAEEPLQPLNPAPATAATFEYTGAKFGEEYCFGVRSVIASGGVSIEGPLSPPGCLTPLDVFPPAAPKGLQAVSTQGQISLIWDPNTEKDLAGYLVLRGDAPEGALTPLTAAPIRETSYSDVAVKPGVRYVYAVVAVDTATPPNTSAESTRREETAR